MNVPKPAKHWKVVEVQLKQASEPLNEPSKFKIEEDQ